MASGTDCIPVVILKNCEPELLYILAELFKMCLKESFFPDCGEVSSVVPVFKNVGKKSTAKNYCLVSFLSVVSKVFEKLVNNRIVDHLEKCGLFSDSQYSFRSFRSTTNLQTVALDRITRAFIRFGTTGTLVLDIWKAFDRVWHEGLLHKVKSYGISGQIFGLILSFLSDKRLRVVLDGSLHKNIQLMLEFFRSPFFVLHFSHCTLMTFLIMLSVILLFMLMVLLATLSVIRDLICGIGF